MGDRSYVALTFGRIDERDAEEVAAFVEKHELSSDGDGFYWHEEALLGTADEYHDRLTDIASHSTWSVSQDPHYACGGWIYYYEPELGTFDTEMNCEGVLLFNTSQVEEIWGNGREERDRRLGKPWLDAMKDN